MNCFDRDIVRERTQSGLGITTVEGDLVIRAISKLYIRDDEVVRVSILENTLTILVSVDIKPPWHLYPLRLFYVATQVSCYKDSIFWRVPLSSRRAASRNYLSPAHGSLFAVHTSRISEHVNLR